jgi:hypothetical protein
VASIQRCPEVNGEQSRSDESIVAVGFNPRFAHIESHRVAMFDPSLITTHAPHLSRPDLAVNRLFWHGKNPQ